VTIKPFEIVRARWRLKELLNDTGKPGIAMLELVIETANLPHFHYAEARCIAGFLEAAADGGIGGRVEFPNDEAIDIWSEGNGVKVRSNGEWQFSNADARQLAADLLEPLAKHPEAAKAHSRRW
jgi:hypothetical protein